MMPDAYTVIPLSPMRRVIAARMSEAKRTIPHFRVVADIDMGALLATRETANAEHPAAKVSVNDCLVKACATALMNHRSVNIQFISDTIHQYRDADISVVVAVESGLSTPVIRQANKKSVWDIAAEMKTLAARSARGKLKMDEIMGGSFSLSNLGANGVDQFDAIINPPQCAILAVGRTVPRIVVANNSVIRVAKMVKATLSVDHRAIDGAAAGAFMSSLRQILEQPGSIFFNSE